MKKGSKSYKESNFSPLSMCVCVEGAGEIQNELSLLSQKRDTNVYSSLLRWIKFIFYWWERQRKISQLPPLRTRTRIHGAQNLCRCPDWQWNPPPEDAQPTEPHRQGCSFLLHSSSLASMYPLNITLVGPSAVSPVVSGTGGYTVSTGSYTPLLSNATAIAEEAGGQLSCGQFLDWQDVRGRWGRR